MKRFKIEVFDLRNDKNWRIMSQSDSRDDIYKDWCNINANKFYAKSKFRLIEVVENILEIKNPK